jgi:hypothetical protein
MPTPPVDISRFPTGEPTISYDLDEEELVDLEMMEEWARKYVMRFRSVPPIAQMVLAFALTPIIALWLVRFVRPIERGELEGETEMWVVAGDMPTMAFETELAPTPSEALRLYCVLAEDWANNVLAGRDLSENYPIPVAPTPKHARMLLERAKYIREEFLPIA